MMTIPGNSKSIHRLTRTMIITTGFFCLLFLTCFLPAGKLGTPAPGGGTYPCRQYLSKETEGPGFGMYGYVLFKELPSGEDSVFYQEIYSAFLNITEFDNLPASMRIDKKALAVIYWPVNADASEKKAAAYADTNRTWPYYLAVYDYAKARLIADNLEQCRGKKGPFIVTSRFPLLVRESLSRNDIDSIFVIDLSAMPSECIKPTFRNYYSRLMKDSGFFARKFSERLGDLRRKVACGMVSMEDNAAFLTAVIDIFKLIGRDGK